MKSISSKSKNNKKASDNSSLDEDDLHNRAGAPQAQVRSITNYDVTTSSNYDNNNNSSSLFSDSSASFHRGGGSNLSSAPETSDGADNNDSNTTTNNSTNEDMGSVKSDNYYGWEEVEIDYGSISGSGFDSGDSNINASSDADNKEQDEEKPSFLAGIVSRFGLGGTKKKNDQGDDNDDGVIANDVDEDGRLLPSFYKHDGTFDDLDPEQQQSGSTLPETNTGTRRSGSATTSRPRFSYNRTKKGEEQRRNNLSINLQEDSSEDSSKKEKKRRGLFAWLRRCCRGLPLLFLLLLLLISAIIAITVVLTREPRDSDKLDQVTNESVSTLPTPSPTTTPLLEACVCYPLLESADNTVSNNDNDNNTGSAPVYNIGGTDYKCLEEQFLTEEEAQSTYLTICVFPNPDVDLGEYHMGHQNTEGSIESIDVTTTGDLSVPNLNQEVDVFAVTTTGSFSVDNLDISSLNEMQLAEVMGYFEDSIAAELDLPPGSTVTITSIDNGVVQYEIVTYNESSADANAAASTIHPTLSQTSTLSNIGNSVLAASQGSSDTTIQSGMVLIDVASHTADITSAPTSISKITTTGEFTIEGFDPSSFSVAQMEEAKEYFESAVTHELESQGFLPEGSSVVVTNLTNGIVEYEIHFYGQTSAQASAAISSVATALSSNSTLESISSTVQTESSSSTTGISTSMSSVSITGNTQTGTTGLTMTAAEEEEAKGYYEDAIASILGPLLPNGATVLVTDVANGVVSYEISMDVNSSEDATSTVDAIQSFLSETSTLEAITMYVEEVSSSSPNQTIVNSLLGATVTSNTTGSTTELSSVNLPLLGMTVTSNTPGTTNIIESTPSNVTFNNLTMEISLDGTSLTTHDLLNQDKGDGGPLYDTVLDSSGTLMAFTINKPISSFSPLDEGFDLANEIEICSSVPLEPNQLLRPEVGGESIAGGESEALLRPEARKLHSSLHFPRDLQQQLVEEIADFCLSIALGLPSTTSDAPAAVPPSGLQV